MKKETREELMYDADYQCQFDGCMERATDAAHRIADTNANATMCRRLWFSLTGEIKTLEWTRANIIDHKFNLAASCRRHNDNFNVGNVPLEVHKIIWRIYEHTGGA
jgi:hypothetical protein